MRTLKITLTIVYNSLKFSAFFIFLLFSWSNYVQGQAPSELRINKVPKLLFITPSVVSGILPEELNDLKSLKNSLSIAGFSLTEMVSEDIVPGKLQGFDIIVLPYASAKSLNSIQLETVAKAVKSGVNLIFDGNSQLTKVLNIRHKSDSISVSTVRDLKYSKDTLYWTSPCRMTPIDNSNHKLSVLCVDDSTQLPLSVSGTYGEGKFIYFGTLFDPITDKGYTRFPFLIETLYSTFKLERITERQAAEMYFDPGNRSDDSLSAADLANLWRKNKIKRIFAAGWYYDTDYDYAELINACHRNGILVLCWLETPMISEKFWNNHPEWREKTVFQHDAQIDWRYLMNLADTNCRKQVFKEFEDFLLKFDWDGVDFAELYFEPSPVGPELPENFTPMNSVVRNEFKRIGGFDPVLLFDTTSSHYWRTNKADWKKFASYRKNLLFRLKKHFLDFFSTIKNKKKDFEVMLTVLDVSITPELSDYIGEDTKNSLALYKMYDITLQVEDPSNCWGLTPQRYDEMGKFYRQYVKEEDRLVFDCNVVSAHELGYGGFPSEIPTGEEIRQIAYNMELHDVRPAFYSEDVVSDMDYKNISTVLANKARITGISENQWKISSPKSVTINTGNANITVKLDNKIWHAGEGEKILIPQGEHMVTFFESKKDTNALWIKNISGELKSATFTVNCAKFTYYEAIASCYVIINKKPDKIYIDGKVTNCQIFTNNKAEFVLKLPQGTHFVKLTASE
jgi:hypothetical protein